MSLFWQILDILGEDDRPSKYTETLKEILKQMPTERNSQDHLKVSLSLFFSLFPFFVSLSFPALITYIDLSRINFMDPVYCLSFTLFLVCFLMTFHSSILPFIR